MSWSTPHPTLPTPCHIPARAGLFVCFVHWLYSKCRDQCLVGNGPSIHSCWLSFYDKCLFISECFQIGDFCFSIPQIMNTRKTRIPWMDQRQQGRLHRGGDVWAGSKGVEEEFMGWRKAEGRVVQAEETVCFLDTGMSMKHEDGH